MNISFFLGKCCRTPNWNWENLRERIITKFWALTKMPMKKRCVFLVAELLYKSHICLVQYKWHFAVMWNVYVSWSGLKVKNFLVQLWFSKVLLAPRCQFSCLLLLCHKTIGMKNYFPYSQAQKRDFQTKNLLK